MKRRSYDRCAAYYDLIEREGLDRSDQLNHTLRKILSASEVRRVVDMTCGTGAQVIGLARQGYQITGVDRSAAMLKVARAKARGLGIRFCHGDIRSVKLGRCDAVISMFNSIGHLSKRGLCQAVKNVRRHLRPGGVFIFDIFNLEHMKSGGFRRYQRVEVTHEIEGRIVTRVGHNQLERRAGVIHVRQNIHIQDGYSRPVLIPEQWDLQIYSAAQLRQVLVRAGFTEISFRNISGGKYNRRQSPSILAIVSMAAGDRCGSQGSKFSGKKEQVARRKSRR